MFSPAVFKNIVLSIGSFFETPTNSNHWMVSILSAFSGIQDTSSVSLEPYARRINFYCNWLNLNGFFKSLIFDRVLLELVKIINLKNIDFIHLGNIWFTGLSSTDIRVILFSSKTHSNNVLIWIFGWVPIITHVCSSVAINHLLSWKFNMVSGSDMMCHL